MVLEGVDASPVMAGIPILPLHLLGPVKTLAGVDELVSFPVVVIVERLSTAWVRDDHQRVLPSKRQHPSSDGEVSRAERQ